MEFLSQKLVIFFAMAFVGSYAALPPEVYWYNTLPNTPMPKAVRDLLPSSSDTMKDEGTSVGVNSEANPPEGVNIGYPGGSVHAKPPGGGVDVGYPGGRVHVKPPGRGGGSSNLNVDYVRTPQGTDVNVGPVGYPGGRVHVKPPGRGGGGGGGGGSSNLNVDYVRTPQGTDVNVGPGGVGVGIGGGPAVSVGHGGVNVIAGPHKGKPVGVSVFPGPSPFNYNYAASEDQLHDNPNVALFFLEKNMTRGSNMNLQFFRTTTGATFLPRHVAESIPFSSNKVAEIFNDLSVNPNSQEAEIMKSTIRECEDPGIQGEEKLCATSLEAMVDFSTSKLGKNIEALATNVMKESSPQQKYTIIGVKKMNDDKAVVCHQLQYAYAVFYCHKTQTTKAYTVSMVGADGTRVEAAAVCHEDTTKWNPKHLAFHILKVKPGHVPVCHFLPEDHIAWVPK